MSNVEAIKELRERTHLGMTACRKALDETKGDVEMAVELLQKSGALKKADPLLETREGLVRSHIKNDSGIIVEINCQTDFAAKSELFNSFVDDFLKSEGLYEDRFSSKAPLLSKQLGEKLVFKRLGNLSSTKGILRNYNHHSGKIAVLLSIENLEESNLDNAELLAFADDLAMQIAANKPLATSKDDAHIADIVKKQMELFAEQSQDKPEKMRDKIVAGKMEKWFSENVLLCQESIVYAKKRVDVLAEELRQKLNSKFVIGSFVRFELGELGMEIIKCH